MKTTHGSPLSSKKFIAYMVAMVLWFCMTATAMFLGLPTTTVLGFSIINGFLQTVYIGSQAALDAYVDGAVSLLSGHSRTKE